MVKTCSKEGHKGIFSFIQISGKNSNENKFQNFKRNKNFPAQ